MREILRKEKKICGRKDKGEEGLKGKWSCKGRGICSGRERKGDVGVGRGEDF